MSKTYEIVPGKSIGPFELGMTRDQIEGLNIRPMEPLGDGAAAFFPLVAVTEGELAGWGVGPHPGVTVSYDDLGRCREISALFTWDKRPPVFTLLGQVVNGMTYGASIELLRSIATDAGRGYGSVSSLSAGVSASMWEASDEHIMCVTVKPPVR